MYPEYWAADDPNKAAVIMVEDGTVLTYGELALHSRQLANAFHDLGLQVGDHVSVQLRNSPRYFEVVWGALLAGLHISPISTYATNDDLAYIVRDSESKVFITSDDFAATAPELPGLVPSCGTWIMLGTLSDGYLDYERVLDDARTDPTPANAPLGEYMLYSSGTTGRPKGILRKLSNRTVGDGSIANRFLNKVFGVDRHSVYLSPAPLYHGAPLGFTMGIISLGGTAAVMRKFEPAVALRSIEELRVTHSQWVPTMFTRLLALDEGTRSAFDLSAHKVAIHSSAPCPRHIKEAMLQWWGPILHEYYSGTEDVGVTYASPQDWLAHPGTVGRPLGFQIHICDENGAELPRRASGLVYFESRRAPFEYHKDIAKTGTARHPEHPNWVTLDDVGYLDEDGFLFLTDRASFMIISGGVNIYPQEIEDVLVKHPSVTDIAVIGIPDEDMGERVLAIVEPVPGSGTPAELESELTHYAQSNLAGPKRPRAYQFVDRLPRLETGKLAKQELVERYARSAT
jgi:fatty-acyl-CoA synthase